MSSPSVTLPTSLRTTPFIRFVYGSRRYPTSSLPETIDDLLANSSSTEDLDALFAGRAGLTTDTGASEADTTWWLLLQELLRELRDDAPHPFDLREYLRVLRTHGWEGARRYLLDNIIPLLITERLSRLWVPDGGTVVRRGGKYFVERSGRVVGQIEGLLTSVEEVYAYLHLETTRPYGRVGCVLRVTALYFTSLHFRSHPDAYRSSLWCVLPESQNQSSFLSFSWRRKESHLWRPTEWRPPEATCNEVWLGEDLLATYTDERGVPPTEEPGPPLQDDSQATWERECADFTQQLEIALDGDVYFGDESEMYFTFEGRRLRWINGDERIGPLLVVPTSGANTWHQELEIANRFLSQLTYEFRVGVAVKMTMGAPKRFRPRLLNTRTSGGIGHPYVHFSALPNPTPQQSLALALYREALVSRSKLYSFLNYYKIVALAGGENQMDEWIRARLSPDRIPGFNDWMTKYVGDRPPVRFLREANRDAIAHVGSDGRVRSGDPTIDPDSLEGIGTVIGSEPIVAALAQIAMQELIPRQR